MGKIIILEGADGVGKTTLANEIVRLSKGVVIHCTYNKEWSIEDYHESVIEAADLLSDYTTVVIDRWALSEYVYGKVFRSGESYHTDVLIDEYKDLVTWVYCKNNQAVENHLQNAQVRDEMFKDMTKVVQEYESYIKDSPLKWLVYDYDKISVTEAAKELLR